MMMLSQAAQALGAHLIGEDVRFTAVSSDSRRIRPGDLFIALRGEKFDGCEFVATAIQSGAVAALVNADRHDARVLLDNPESLTPACAGRSAADRLNPGFPLLIVADTRLALGQLAAYWRKQFNIPLVALTGSNGKTTVKEMLARILRTAAGNEDGVLATQGNLNNDIGMPLTLLQMNAQHRYAVIEMGMNHPGEIAYLTHIATPDVALITNASDAHLAGLGSVEAVARAKGEIFAGLKTGGTAVINADDAYAPLWRTLAGAHPLLEFALECPANVTGQWRAEKFGLHLEVQTPLGKFSIEMRVHGAHNARNALAATAAAIALNAPLESIATGLKNFNGVAGRIQYKTARYGATLIDDTYNANPASVRAAINVLTEAGGKRVLVMGDMGELGADTAFLHASVGTEARCAGIEKLYTLGEMSRNAVRAFGCGAEHFEHIEDLQSALEDEMDEDTTLLVKGSRFMKMERVVQFCIDGEKAEEINVNAKGKREKGSCALASPSPFTLHPSHSGKAH